MNDDYDDHLEDEDLYEEDIEDELHEDQDSDAVLEYTSEDSDHHIVFGDPEGDQEWWNEQETSYNCAVVQQQGIIEAFTGEDQSQVDLTALAIEHGLTTRKDGTELPDIGKLLNYYGVETHSKTDACIGDVIGELSQAHKVIVGVHGGEPDHSLASILGTSSPDQYGHALWVTGVDVNVDHPEDTVVTVNDSADPDGAGKVYSLDEFKEMWSGTDFFYLSTDEGPGETELHPAGFDQEHHVFPEMVDWMQRNFPDVGGIGLAVGTMATGVDLTRAIREKAQARKNPPAKPEKSAKQQESTTQTAPETDQSHERKAALTPAQPKRKQQQPADPTCSTPPSGKRRVAKRSDDTLSDSLKKQLQLNQAEREAKRKNKLLELQQQQRQKIEQEIEESKATSDESDNNVVYLKKTKDGK